ncbi:hypothetical protein BGAL_0371g00010 [Botrytis galanthina]|uniref:Uncharacterized protein n=1 Tax=Botrytis galanthina TaxID=278940 RepID=A0A4S8QNI5_9HELO|nr:hypothetical protein BGAL_0371g00010 [Botrytis galanthina]
MRERSDASYHHATFEAPNLRGPKSFTFPLNYTGEPAPLVKETGKKKAPIKSNADTRDSSRDVDGIDRKDFAPNKKASKTSNPHVQGSSRNGGVGDLNKPAKKAKKKTSKGEGDSAVENNERLRKKFWFHPGHDVHFIASVELLWT